MASITEDADFPFEKEFGSRDCKITEITGKDADIFTEDKIVGKLCRNFSVVAKLHLAKFTKPKTIFIRECYKEFTDDIVTKVNEITENKRLKLTISGTPQIGKSTLLSYLLAELPKRTSLKRIVVIAERESSTLAEESKIQLATVIYYNEHCRDITGCNEDAVLVRSYRLLDFNPSKIEKFAECAMTNNCLTILDGFSVLPSYIDLFGDWMVFSSQGITETKMRCVDAVQSTWFMPAWTKKELEDFSKSRCDINLVIPDKSSLDDMIELFGGCIGYMVSDFQQTLKQIYTLQVKSHLERFHYSSVALDVDNPQAAAGLIEVIPDPDDRKIFTKRWLSDTMEERIRSGVELMEYNKKKRETMETTGVRSGISFENLLGTYQHVIPPPLKMILYDKFGVDKNWSKCEASILQLQFESPSRFVDADGDEFPMKFQTLNRMMPNAPAIDYYFVQKKKDDDRNSKYKVYMIQATVGKSHALDLKHIRNYLKQMNSQILWNRTERPKNTEMAWEQNKYVMKDTGKDLELTLDDDNVEIWFLYLQESLKKSFNAPIHVAPLAGAPTTRSADVPNEVPEKVAKKVAGATTRSADAPNEVPKKVAKKVKLIDKVKWGYCNLCNKAQRR